jgi:hypothetical protein
MSGPASEATAPVQTAGGPATEATAPVQVPGEPVPGPTWPVADPGDVWAGLLAPGGPVTAVYQITVSGAVVDAVRLPVPQDATGRLVRGILDNAHGKLANTWREGLIRTCDGLTKRQARSVVAEAAPWAQDVTPLELPAHRLHELPAAVATSLRLANTV